MALVSAKNISSPSIDLDIANAKKGLSERQLMVAEWNFKEAIKALRKIGVHISKDDEFVQQLKMKMIKDLT